MKGAHLDVLGAVLVLGSLYFFHHAVRSLAGKDYIAAIIEIFVGLAIIRSGIELSKLATIRRGRP